MYASSFRILTSELRDRMRENKRFKTDKIGYLSKRRERDGDAYYMGPGLAVISDLQITRRILARTNTDFATVPGRVQYLRDESAAWHRSSAATWMPARRIALEGLRQAATLRRAPKTLSVLDDVLASVGDRSVEVVPLMKLVAGAITSETLFSNGSVDLRSLTDGRSALLANSMVRLSATHPRARRARAMFQELQSLVAAIYRTRLTEQDERVQGGQNRNDVLDLLIDARGTLSDTQIEKVLSVNLRAGIDVPGAALSWLLLSLDRHCVWRQRLRHEAGIEGCDSVSSVDGLPLATAVVKETLRLYSPTWFLQRLSLRDQEVFGFKFRRGMRVMILPYFIHRDSRYWHEPDEYRPGRWIEDSGDDLRAYIPFGTGARMCMGRHVGLLQLALVASRICQRYDIELTSVDDRPRFDALMVPAAMQARFIQRKN